MEAIFMKFRRAPVTNMIFIVIQSISVDQDEEFTIRVVNADGNVPPVHQKT